MKNTLITLICSNISVRNLIKKYLAVDVADAFANKLVPRGAHLTFLDNMIYEGKKLYLAHKLLPKKDLAALLRYSDEKYQWAEDNESEIWRYFIEKTTALPNG